MTADDVDLSTKAVIGGATPRIELFESDTTDLNTRIRNTAGALQIQSTDDAGSTSKSRIVIDHATGDIAFREDTGTTAKFYWDASEESLGLGTSSPATTLDVSGTATISEGTSGASATSDSNTLIVENNGNAGMSILTPDGSNGQLRFGDATDSSSAFVQYNSTDNLMTVGTTRGSGELRFTTGNVGERMRIDANGDVGIGTSSPDSELHVFGTGSGDGTFGPSITIGKQDGPKISSTQESADNDVQGLAFFTKSSATLADPATEVVRIDSAGNVGIGTTTPAESLHVAGNIRFGDTAPAELYTNTSELRLGVDKNNDNATSVITFYADNAEKIRMNDSGQLLVGKTTSGDNNDGIQLEQSGRGVFTRDGNVSAYFNRKTSNGDIVRFALDNTTVGDIGVIGDDVFYISCAEDVGIRLDGDNNNVTPSLSNGNTNDNAIDLGAASNRWKDLYLSGGAYIGGTGSANKLDDYEEGSFTPAFSGGDYTFTYNKQKGSYTKIGNRVFVDMHLNIDSSTAPSGTTDGDLSVTGLPFAFNAQNSVDILAVSIGFKQEILNAEDSLSIRFASGNTEFKIHKDLSTGFPDTTLLQASDLAANSRLRIQFSYPTNS